MRWLLVLALVGCIAQARQAVAPESQDEGTLSCKEIVETCDANCTDPFCLTGCTGKGTAEARPQHQALLDCGQQHRCTDEDCMRASCPSQIDTCWGEHVAAPAAQGGD